MKGRKRKQKWITFSDRSAWRSLLVLKPDLLQRHQVVRQLTASFKYCGVGTLNIQHRLGSILDVGFIWGESDEISDCPHLSQLVQFNVRLQLPKSDLRLRKRERRKSELSMHQGTNPLISLSNSRIWLFRCLIRVSSLFQQTCDSVSH